jgi:hypothetical protein
MSTAWVVETPESVTAPAVRIKPTQHKQNQQSNAAASNPLIFVASERVIRGLIGLVMIRDPVGSVIKRTVRGWEVRF